MKIQINTGPNTDGREQVARQAEGIIENTLGHRAEHVSRVEVHLSDQTSDQGGGADQRCMMEARLEGRPPIAVTEEAATMVKAITGAAEKLKHSLDHILGRSSSR
jgi:ribosome-associated translation inhibitor RaiA